MIIYFIAKKKISVAIILISENYCNYSNNNEHYNLHKMLHLQYCSSN